VRMEVSERSRTKQMPMNSRGSVDCGLAYFPLRWNEDAD
jgi:hypothetical protein